MRGIGWISLVTMLGLASGCVYAYQSMRPAPRYWVAARPEPSYYCYDCHGYRYFDPYYDWCPQYRFVFGWSRAPQVTRIYRERYVALRSRDRQMGRFRYPDGYRGSRRYRDPVDYDRWRGTRGAEPGYEERDDKQVYPKRGDPNEKSRPVQRRKRTRET